MRVLGGLPSGIAALALLGACAGEPDQFQTQFSPGLTGKAHTLSVFGVFRDGRMSTRAWDELAPKLTDMLGLDPCDAAYGAELVTNYGALASAIDDYSKNYGVTDPLLDQLAPAAEGDLILVVVVAGAPKPKGGAEPQTRPRPAPGPSGPGGRMRRAPFPGRAEPRETATFDVVFSVFSPKEHAMVGAVAFHYTGTSEDVAFAKVQAKWKELFPKTSCKKWDFEAHPVDSDSIRVLPEP
jgi:hypothetical protein